MRDNMKWQQLAVCTIIASSIAGCANADDTATLQRRLDAGGDVVIAGMHTLSTPLRVPSNTTLTFAPSAVLRTSVADMSFIEVMGKSNVTIRGGRLIGASTTGKKAYVAGVKIAYSRNVTIENMKLEGMQWAGVYAVDVSGCRVSGLAFTRHVGQVGDSAAVALHDGTNHCVVENNVDRSGAHVSYFIQDTSNGKLPPHHNIIRNNVSRGAGVYGAAIYISHASPLDTFNEILENDIADVSDAAYGHGGSPIYVVGFGAGGAKVVGNKVADGCQYTRDRQNAPAGISVSNIPKGATAVTIRDNDVTGMIQGDGIAVTSSPGGAIIENNRVTMPRQNDGALTRPGGVELRGNALRIANSSNVTVTGGSYTHRGVADAVLLLATADDMRGIRFRSVSARTLPGARDEKGVLATGHRFRSQTEGRHTIDADGTDSIR